MTRSRRALLLLLGFQAALSGCIVLMERARSCLACVPSGLSPGVAGLVFYSALLIAAWMNGRSGILFGGIHVAFGVHCALAAQMFLSGRVCGLCLAAAAGSLALVVMSISMDRANLGRIAWIVPASALLVAAGFGVAPPRGPALGGPEGAVGILIFSEPDCPYCDELRTQVLPDIENEFGARIRVAWHPASELPAIRRTPTLILSSGRSGTPDRVIEGLPSVERLRAAIRELEIGS